MAKHGKKFTAAVSKVEPRPYPLDEALGLAKELSFVKFDETVEVAVRLGVDPKHADQMVRGTVVLPHGTGKTVRVLVFASGEKIKEAEDAGAFDLPMLEGELAPHVARGLASVRLRADPGHVLDEDRLAPARLVEEEGASLLEELQNLGRRAGLRSRRMSLSAADGREEAAEGVPVRLPRVVVDTTGFGCGRAGGEQQTEDERQQSEGAHRRRGDGFGAPQATHA